MSVASAIRLPELLGTLSLAVDLGLGQPEGHVGRAALAAARLGERVGVPDAQRREVFELSLMGWVGCIADSRDAAAWFGDDIAYRAGVYDLDMRPLPFLGYLLRHAGSNDPAPTRAAKKVGVLLDGGRSVQESLRAHCQVTTGVARRLGVREEVCACLPHIFARWDGQGLPRGLAGEDIALPLRIWQLTDVAEVHYRRAGPQAARAVIRDRQGGQFDPDLVAALSPRLEEVFGDLEEDWESQLDYELTGGAPLTEAQLDSALATLGDWVDLKSPWFGGHSRNVADLAAAAASRLGLADGEVARVRRAGFVHGLGRVGVPNTVWDKCGPLTAGEFEKVRLHSYLTERVLQRHPALANLGELAGAAHERLDGSGYHRGLRGASLTREARVLAAASAYRTKLEPRPHRGALSTGAAAEHVRGEVNAGRLDRAAVEAVLAVAGLPPGDLPPGPAGLTPREVEVLRHVASGATNRQVARALGISPKTVGNHVEHVYAKAQVSTRAAATLFAMEHQLLDEPPG